jgi:hypothetical protein
MRASCVYLPNFSRDSDCYEGIWLETFQGLGQWGLEPFAGAAYTCHWNIH